MQKPKVYIASKVDHADKWQTLRDIYTHDLEFTCTWIDNVMDPEGGEYDPNECQRIWIMDVADVKRSDVVIVYAEEHEHLRGALIEAGVAIASGIPVIVVGKSKDYGTWQYHPHVHRRDSMRSAITFILGGL